MKTRLLIIIVSVGLSFSIPYAFASESFFGTSSFENIPSKLIPGKPTQFEIKFQYTSEPYALDNLISIIDVNPASAKSHVQIDVKPLEGITQGQIARIPVAITVEPQIEHEQIFLSVSFTGDHFSSRSDATYKSAWSDSVIIDIEKTRIPEPQQDEPIYENCGPGTTLQDGMCIVDKSRKPPSNSSAKWGAGVGFESSWRPNQSNVVSMYDDFFSINEKQVRYNVFYNVTNASISNVQLNCDSSSLSFSIMPDDEGVLHLDIPKGLLGGIFMVQVNGQEWVDVSLDGNVLTINFPAYEAAVKVLGTYHLYEEENDGVCDMIHDPPYSYVLSPLEQSKSGVSSDEIQCKENMVLLQKHNGSPACVKESTMNKLIKRGWTNLEPKTCPDGYSYNETLFRCVVSCERDLVYNGYTDSCTTAFELKYHGYCNEGYTYQQSTHACLSDDGALQTPLKDPPRTPPPEPELESVSELQLRTAKKSLQTAYREHVNLGPYYMKDVIVGFGTYGDVLIVDIASKYTDSDSFQTVKKEVQHIVGNNISVDYVVYDEPIERHIETVIPYLWNQILHQNKIDFVPKNQTYWNNADGFADPDKVCSPLVASNGTEFYISSTFTLEPFEITGTSIDKIQPDNCHKIWKTDVLMPEPDRVTALWLENEN